MDLTLKKLSKNFGNKTVLQQISIEFKVGKTYAVVGRNGAGKSTLFNIICGLIRSDSGEILFDGDSYAYLPTVIKQKIGFLSEQGIALAGLGGVQFLKLIGRLYRVRDIKSKALNLIQYFFDEDELEGKIIRQYSSGMKRKIEICSALIHEPELLILDEPFIGLDSIGVDRLIKYLIRYNTNNDRSIILSSHQVDHFERLNAELILLDKQEIRYQGTISEFKGSYGDSLHDGLLNIYSQPD